MIVVVYLPPYKPCLSVYFSGGTSVGVMGADTQIVTVTDPVTGQQVQQLIQTQIDPSTGQATQVVLPATNVVTVKDPVTGQIKQQTVPTSTNQGIFTLGSLALMIKIRVLPFKQLTLQRFHIFYSCTPTIMTVTDPVTGQPM